MLKTAQENICSIINMEKNHQCIQWWTSLSLDTTKKWLKNIDQSATGHAPDFNFWAKT